MATELDLPLPAELTVYVYPTRKGYAQGLMDVGGIAAGRAAELAEHSVGVSQPRRLFLSDEVLRELPWSTRLSVLAHELTHVAQYELSGGRRGESEQWLREGMADWVACWTLERLGEGTFGRERWQAVRAVAHGFPAADGAPLDLVQLGRPRG